MCARWKIALTNNRENVMNKIIVFALLACISQVALSSPCDQLFPNGKEIVVPKTAVLCNSFFVSVYDTDIQANIFSSEIATPRNSKVTRTNNFRADPRVKNSPTPDDYTNTGFDRGHMVPAADSNTPEQMSDTFYMTNMTPQVPSVNRVAWRLLEEKVRTLPFKYVVTGAIYSNVSTAIGSHNVSVPTELWKVVYLEDGTTQAFSVANTKDSKVIETQISVIESKLNYKLH